MESKVGAVGTVRGVPVSGLESAESPAALVATTDIEYSVPFTKVEISHESNVVVQVLVVVPSVAVAV